MDLLTRGDLQELFDFEGHPCVTLMMPIHRTGREMRQDLIRLKNLLSKAEDDLVDFGLRRPAARELLQPAAALADDAFFWQTHGTGLAIFLAPGFFRRFRLPLHFDERLVQGERFHVLPLVPMLQHDGRFYIIAMSLHKVRIFQADRQRIQEIEIDGVPQGLTEALGKEYEQSIQWHSERGWSYAGGGAEIGMFHGQSDSNPKSDILEYCRAVDRPVSKRLAAANDPFVFAGVEYLFPLYREANSYAHLVSECVTGNFDDIRPEELHELAGKVVDPIFKQAQDEAIRRYNDRIGNGAAGHELAEILEAACDGRIDTLLVARDAHNWGRFDAETRQLTRHDAQSGEGEDLLDRAAAETIRRGGKVFVLAPEEVPGGSSCAAVYRYAISPQQA